MMDGPADWQRGDRALTLHMLSRLGPEFFASEALESELVAALDELEKVPASFEASLPLDQAMSRLDALYLRRLRGLSVPVFDGAQLERYITELTRSPLSLLPGWLMGEQARLLGVDAAPRLPTRFPFADQDWILHLYHLAHIVMLKTGYFLHWDKAGDLADEMEQMQRSVAPLIAAGRWDLLAEVQLCLRANGRFNGAAAHAIRKAQRADGSWAERGQGRREAAHTTAACLLALATDAREALA
jgi:hypothetical protein